MPNLRPVPYAELRDKPWGHEVIYTPTELERVGKILFVTAGKKLSLQYHDLKEETITMFSGKALLWWKSDEGEVEKIPMEAQKGYTVYPGTIHRIEAIEDSYFLEVSSSEEGTTFRLEDDYSRSDEIR